MGAGQWGEEQDRVKATRKGLSQRPLAGFANLAREPIPKQYAAWLGVRFHDPEDEPDCGDDQGDSKKLLPGDGPLVSFL